MLTLIRGAHETPIESKSVKQAPPGEGELQKKEEEDGEASEGRNQQKATSSSGFLP